MDSRLIELRKHLLEIHDLEAVATLAGWDQRTYMPPGGAASRARQISVLLCLAHERFIDPVIGNLLDALRPYEESLPYDSDYASLVRVTRRDYERAVRIPPAFKAEYDHNAAMTYQVWCAARANDDFSSVQPYLERTLHLSLLYASFFPDANHPIDPLIALFDEGITGAILKQLFNDLQAHLVPMVHAIAEQQALEASFLKEYFPAEKQLAFCSKVVQSMGHDLQRGREDLSDHLGHGIGVTVHEPPFLDVVDPTSLQDSMTFTVEPSIRIPGGYHNRVEDVVLVTPTGGVSLYQTGRQLDVVG